jgi:hypothetical protein
MNLEFSATVHQYELHQNQLINYQNDSTFCRSNLSQFSIEVCALNFLILGTFCPLFIVWKIVFEFLGSRL